MKYYTKSDIGVFRSENQDRVAFLENDLVYFLILCDGMGGHFGGSMASSITIDVFKNNLKYISEDETEIYEWFKNTSKKAKNTMVDESGNNLAKKDMGTTVTAAVIFKKTKEIYVFNIGDSRTYIYENILYQVTIDHNLMNYYMKNESMSESVASMLPGAHSLTSALGPNKKTNIDAFNVKSSKEKRCIILTSDGVHDFIPKPNLEIIIGDKNMTLEEKGDKLISEGINGGSTDNLSVIIMEIE